MSKNSIHLNETQRQELEQPVRAGTAPVRSIMHAHILLKADTGPQGPRWSDVQMRSRVSNEIKVIRAPQAKAAQTTLPPGKHLIYFSFSSSQ